MAVAIRCLEFDGRVVGFFGNYAQTYWQGERAFKVAIASQWGIEKAHRTATAMLSDAYFAQPNAEMILVTTGIKPTGRLFERFGGEPVPQPGLDQIRFWVTASGGFLAATLSKKGWPGGGLVRHLNLPPALTWPRPPRRALTVSARGTFDARFDRLFAAKRQESHERLLADRGAAALAWHVASHARRGGLRVLEVAAGNDLDGYGLMVRGDRIAPVASGRHAGPWRSAGLVTDLVGAAVRLAADDGGQVLEVGGMASTLQATIDILHPLRRRLPTWPCFFLMATGIDAPTGWYLSAYDGDTILF
ncbi:MAG: hypothetical protein O3A88_04035 [Proteobacteria bacterium]|nr:hypothetical protein [Pseudomonadota bacterium]